MKTTFFDYLSIGSLITILILASWKFSTFIYSLLPIYNSTILIEILIVCIFIFPIIYGVFSAVLVRYILFFKPLPVGEFSMQDSVFQYWKLLTMLYMFGQRALFLVSFPPMIPVIARLFGAKIGKNVAIGGTIDTPFLVSIGDNSVLGFGSLISGNIVFNDKIIIGRVDIGANSTVGIYSVIMPNVRIGHNVLLVTNSVLIQGSEIPDNEIWKGHPARKWK